MHGKEHLIVGLSTTEDRWGQKRQTERSYWHTHIYFISPVLLKLILYMENISFE